MKQRNKGLLYRSWRYFSAVLGLQRCQVCQKTLPSAPISATRFEEFTCTDCRALLRTLQGIRCQQCGLSLGPRPQAFGWALCRHCKTAENPLPHHTLVCADYAPPVDQWITQLKYGTQPHMAQFLGAWLADRVLQAQTPLPNLLIPVPSTPHKLKRRGYNQAHLIAKALGKELDIPVHPHWLEKKREGKTQADLSRQDRLVNQADMFRATRPMSPNQTIGLVDDVITTGATVHHCVQTLKKAGAKDVLVLAIYRTPE